MIQIKLRHLIKKSRDRDLEAQPPRYFHERKEKTERKEEKNWMASERSDDWDGSHFTIPFTIPSLMMFFIQETLQLKGKKVRRTFHFEASQITS